MIIPANKTRLLMSHEHTGAGSDELLFSIETDALRLHGFMPVNAGSVWWELFELGGNIDGFERLVYRSPTYKGVVTVPEVYNFTGGQLFKMVVHHTAAVTYHLMGTSVSGSQDRAGAVSTELVEQKLDASIRTLDNIEYQLKKIVNHLRVMTEINDDEGEDF